MLGDVVAVIVYGSWIVISAYHHWSCEFESRSGRGVHLYVIKFVSDLQQISGFLRVLWFPPPIQTDHHDIAEILLKVALTTIKQQQHAIDTFPWSADYLAPPSINWFIPSTVI